MAKSGGGGGGGRRGSTLLNDLVTTLLAQPRVLHIIDMITNLCTSLKAGNFFIHRPGPQFYNRQTHTTRIMHTTHAVHTAEATQATIIISRPLPSLLKFLLFSAWL